MLSDNPMPLLMLGVLVQIMLGMILWQTRERWAALLMVAFGFASIGALAFEILYVSPTEQVAARLDEIAAIVETNDHERVLDCFAPEALPSRAEALAQLRQIKVEEAVMAGDLKIVFDPPANPEKPEAIATFNARAKVKFLREAVPYNQVVQRLRVWFRKENGQWMVTNFELIPR